jgi:HEAT repeat protein
MTRYCCPYCRSIFNDNYGKCPECELDIDHFYHERTYFQKLVAALQNPETETRCRAIAILGKIGDPRAVPPLLELLHTVDDYYAMRTIIESLEMLGGEESYRAIQKCTEHKSVIVRSAARDVCARRKSGIEFSVKKEAV